jgi:hypothetical protein
MVGQSAAAAAVLSRVGTSPIAAFNEVGMEYESLVQDFFKNVQQAEEGVSALNDKIKENTDLAEQMADAQLAINNAMDQVEAGTAELTEATKERVEEEKELERELAQHKRKFLFDLAEREIKLSHDLLDNARDYANQRLKLERDLLADLEKMSRKYGHDQADSAQDLADEEADIIRKHEQQLIDDEIEAAKKRISVEEEYLKRIAELRRKYAFDAAEAIRQNDAVALLRLRRKLEFDLNEERIKRDEKLDEERSSEDTRAQERQRELERELEAAGIANERRLRDLATALAREREERRIAHELALEETRIQEALKRKEIQQNFERERAEAKRQYDFQLNELKLAGELAINKLREIEAQKLKVVEQANAALAQAYALQRNIIAGARAGISIRGGGGGYHPSTPLGSGLTPTFDSPGFQSGGSFGSGQIGQIGQATPMAFGGPIWTGRPIVVGDPQRPGVPNPELLIPRTHGWAHPIKDLAKLFMFSPPRHQVSPGGGTPTYLQAQVSLLDPTSFSPIQHHIIEKTVTKIMRNAWRPY